MTTAQEAKQLVARIHSQLLEPAHDLRAILRQCYLLCNLLGWTDTESWFDHELNGFVPEEEVPPNRIVAGVRQWQATSLDEIMRSTAAQQTAASTFI